MSKEYDPRMHSAEHILNQTMVRMFGRGRSFSAHIEKKKSKCDYHFERDLTADERVELERRVNEVIASDVAVREEHLAREEALKGKALPEGHPLKRFVLRINGQDYDVGVTELD